MPVVQHGCRCRCGRHQLHRLTLATVEGIEFAHPDSTWNLGTDGARCAWRAHRTGTTARDTTALGHRCWWRRRCRCLDRYALTPTCGVGLAHPNPTDRTGTDAAWWTRRTNGAVPTTRDTTTWRRRCWQRPTAAVQRVPHCPNETRDIWIAAAEIPATVKTRRFESLGLQLPERRLTTRALLESAAHHPHIDLEALTGIHERRVCADGEDSFTLAVAAARDCLAHSHHPPEDIEMLISASISKYKGGLRHQLEAAAEPRHQTGDRC